MRTLAILLLCFFTTPALAVGVDEAMLEDPAQEAHARDLMAEFRCLVCQNQSVEDSNADLARDIRMIVRERIAAGDSDEEIRAFMQVRYGDWIMMKPPFNANTVVLWVGPFLLLIGAGFTTWLYVRRQRNTVPETLSAEEQTRLKALLDEPRDH